VAALLRMQRGWIAVCWLIVAAGCARVEEPVPVVQDPAVVVTCIAVLPARTVVDFDQTVSAAEGKALQDGVQILNVLLREQLKNTGNLVFITAAQVEAIEEQSGGEGRPSQELVAKRFSCNLILETTLVRYADRVGGQYGAKEPAAVTFSYKLHEVETGRVLCHGRFEERQQSVMENLLALGKARSRGLTWITAEEMLREGLKEKLEKCPYLVGR